MKKYSTPCTISLAVTYEDGRHGRIKFETSTGLGSYYITSNQEDIWALEHCSEFNKEFFLEREESDEPKESNKVEEEKKDEGPIVVEVDTISEAKEYLNKNFGIPRSNIKTLAQALSAGYDNKIIFKGLTEEKKE